MNISLENDTGNSNVSYTTTVDKKNPALAVWYVLLGPAVVMSNGVILFLIFKWDDLRESPTIWTIGFMATFDLCNGLNNIFVGIPSSFLGRFAYGDLIIHAGALVTAFILVQNEFSVAMTVIDRFISVQWSLHYSLIATKKKYATAFVVSILLNVFRLVTVCQPTFSVYYNGLVGKPLIHVPTGLGTLVTAVVIITPLIIISFCSFRILAEIKRISGRDTLPTARSSTSKSTLMILMSTAMFCLSNVPKLVYILLAYAIGDEYVPTGFVTFCALCVTSHSLWNVFIYTITYQPFRNNLMKTFCKSYYRKQQQANMVVIFHNS